MAISTTVSVKTKIRSFTYDPLNRSISVSVLHDLGDFGALPLKMVSISEAAFDTFYANHGLAADAMMAAIQKQIMGAMPASVSAATPPVADDNRAALDAVVAAAVKKASDELKVQHAEEMKAAVDAAVAGLESVKPV